MSKAYKEQDWEKVLSKLTAENKQTPSQGKTSSLGVLSFLILNAFSALAVMRINSTINSTWEDMELVRPGIGYADAFMITGLVWFLFVLKAVVTEALRRSNDQS